MLIPKADPQFINTDFTQLYAHITKKYVSEQPLESGCLNPELLKSLLAYFADVG